MNKRVIYTKPDSLLASYFKDISKYKPLPPEKLNELIVEAKEGSTKARDKVVNSNLKFVVTIAKQFQGRGVPLMDLIGTGTLGLIKAVNKFDPTRGVKFLSYAVWWIKQSIYTALYWTGREIRLPVSQHALVIKILDATNKFIKQYGRNPTTNELHELTNIDASQIDYLSQFSNHLVSVDDFLGGDEEHSQVCDVIPDGEPPLEDQVNRGFINKEIEKCLDTLPIRERDLLMLYFGLGVPELDSTEIGKMLGLGRERVRQLKEKALSKIRKRCNLQLSKLV